MARLSNNDILAMSIKDADMYTDRHPAEAWRFAKLHGKSATKNAGKAIRHGFKSGILFVSPAKIKVSSK